MHNCNKRARRDDLWGPMAMLFAGSMASRFGRPGGPGRDRGWGGPEEGAGWGGPGRGGAGRGGPGRGGPGGRRGRMFGQGELRLALLKLLADEPRHGYELIKAFEELTGGAYAPSPGAVYPTLQLLADEGVIEEQASEGSPRKAFTATEQGRAELEGRAEEVDALFARLSSHAEEHQRGRSPQLFRAMGNLASVLKQRARADKLDEATLNEIVDMIDEAARRIERL